MARKYPSQKCVNPDCQKLFNPRRRNHIYCEDQCRINYNNDNRRKKNLTDYQLENLIKKNEKILKKLLTSPYCIKDEIRFEFIAHEGYDFNVSSDSLENNKSGKMIRWCHTHGLEVKNMNPKTFVIHKRDKIIPHAKS